MQKTFKRPYLTNQATKKLGIHKYTLWKWGESGKVRMIRDGIQKIRVFDGDEIDALAPRMKKDRIRGYTVYPQKTKRK